MSIRALVLLGVSIAAYSQPLDPAKLLQPPTDTWPTFNGDYSGRRFSTLTQINAKNVRNLALAWAYRADSGPEPNPFGVEIKATPLLINGVLYFTMPDNAWAIDARDGHQLWHYFWKTKGGTHIGNRGLGMWNTYLFMETPDDYLVSLDSKTGKELWVTKIDAGAHSAPITFRGKDGKQYIVVTATGGGFLGDRSRADTVIAYALP